MQIHAASLAAAQYPGRPSFLPSPSVQEAWEEVVGAAVSAAAEKGTPLLHDPDVLGQLVEKMQVGRWSGAGLSALLGDIPCLGTHNRAQR